MDAVEQLLGSIVVAVVDSDDGQVIRIRTELFGRRFPSSANSGVEHRPLALIDRHVDKIRERDRVVRIHPHGHPVQRLGLRVVAHVRVRDADVVGGVRRIAPVDQRLIRGDGALPIVAGAALEVVSLGEIALFLRKPRRAIDRPWSSAESATDAG